MSLADATLSELRKEIARARNESATGLAKAQGITDYSRYMYSVGFIEALDQISQYIEDTQERLMKA